MCLNGRNRRPAWPPDCQRASLVRNDSAARRNDCNGACIVWPKNALIGRAEDMKVYDFPKLALARCCPLDARQADEKEKGIEGGKRN